MYPAQWTGTDSCLFACYFLSGVVISGRAFIIQLNVTLAFCFLLSWRHKHFVVHLFFCVILGSPSILCCILAGSKRRSHYDLVTLNASLCFGLTFQATNLFLSSVTAQGCSVFASFRHLCPRSVETIVSWGMWGSLWIAGVLFASSCGCFAEGHKGWVQFCCFLLAPL